MEVRVNRALVKKLRLDNSWSQEVLANKAGLNLRTIQRIESKGIASLQTRRSVATALGIEPSALEVNSNERGSGLEFLLDKGAILVGLYAFTVALSLGFVILDQMYAYLINNQIASADSAFVFSEVADFLLQFGFFSTLIAIGAIYVVWKHKWVRLLIIASILVGSAFPTLFILILNGFFPEVWNAMSENSSGALVRFSAQALAAVFALWGWITYSRSRQLS